MTAVGWDDQGDESCSGPCCPPAAPAETPRGPGLLARIGITLRTARKGQPPQVHPHERGAGTDDVFKAVVKDRQGFTVLYGMYGAKATAVVTGAVANIDLTPVINLGVRSLRIALAIGPTRAEVEQILERDFGPLPFICPQCSRSSWHPQDKQYGYCGACHAYTGEPS